MSIGLDLGTTQFRSLRRQGQRLVGRHTACVYAAIADTPAHRRELDREDASFLECDDELILIGDSATNWTERTSVRLRSLLPDGRLPADDPRARAILPFLVDAVLPLPTFEDEVCAITIPGELFPDEPGMERPFFTELVERRGYRPVVIGQGLSIVLAELGDAAFSGIGISLGSSQCEFALVHCGAEEARCSIPWGVAEIASALPSQTSAAPVSLSTLAESGQLISDFLVELLLEAGTRIGRAGGFRVLSEPVSIVCGGGLAQRPEFEALLLRAWHRAAWPIAVRALRIAPDATYTVARGCLIQAKLEFQAETLRAAA